MKPGSFLLTTLVLLSIMVSGQDVAPDAAIQSTSQQANSDQSTSFEDATLQMAYSQTIGSEDPTYHFQPGGAGYTAANSAHNLGINVDESAVTISMAGDTWQLSSNDHASSLTLDENRLTIHRSGFDEWYVNGPLGLQQGFTVYQPSEIAFDVGGTLATTARDQSLSIGDTLTFSGLMAYDAAGQTVPVKFALDNDKLAYVYDDSGATYPLTIDPWFQSQRIVSGDPDTEEYFGYSVAIDGDTALVGAVEDTCAFLYCGSAYVFIRSGSTWIQQAKLVANDAYIGDRFGSSVALSGNTAVIGAEWKDCAAGIFCGSAYVFVRSGSTWTQQAKLVANDADEFDSFGISVAVSGDTALIGASDNDCGAGSSCGSAYVFQRSGSVWFQHQKLTASDADSFAYFGHSVDIEGTTAIIGAYGADCTGGFSCGNAYVFTRGTSFWFQQQKLMASDGATLDYFGTAVALSGNTALIGATRDDCASGVDCGSAYVFTRSGSFWSQQQKLMALDATFSDFFGASVDIDGNVALIGAEEDTCAGGVNCGSAYVFTRSGSTWTQRQKVVPNDLTANDYFAGPESVALDGGTAIIGAWGDDCTAGVDCGSAYIFNTAPLTVSIACSGPNLQVTISNGDGPFNITASAGVNTPKLGVGIGTTTVNGPEKWDDLTVTELGGNAQSINYGQFRCRSTERPAPLTPAHGSHTTNTSPLFSWTAITDANNYRLFVFDDANVATRTVDIRQNSGGPTSMTLSTPLPTMRLFWRVRGRQNRIWSLWSVRFTLFVDPVVAAPGVADTAPVPSGADGSSPPNNRDGMTPVPTIAAPPPTQLPQPPNSR